MIVICDDCLVENDRITHVVMIGSNALASLCTVPHKLQAFALDSLRAVSKLPRGSLSLRPLGTIVGNSKLQATSYVYRLLN